MTSSQASGKKNPFTTYSEVTKADIKTPEESFSDVDTASESDKCTA